MNSNAASGTSDDWDFYFRSVDGVPSSLFVNLSAIRRAPMPEMPWLLWVCVQMRIARDDGLSSSEEAPRLFELEDRLTEVLSGAEFVGRITGSGRREFHYYARTGDGLDSAIAQVQFDFPEYFIEHEIRKDPEWRQYREVLYPSAEEMHRITNLRVLKQLAEHGDDHTVPRVVDHMLYFRAREDRARFVDAVETLGFQVRVEAHDALGQGERPYSLNLVRTDPVTMNHIDAVVLQLVELAGRFDADYDGWGCEVTKLGSSRTH